VELKDRHIRSNVLSPGPTDTPIVVGQPADAIARIVSTILMGRIGEPDEIAKAALFLASDDSSFVTGMTHCCRRVELPAYWLMRPQPLEGHA
jgi:NAD(P)-dependent dehydrogenase (short-subunit alcohol dehydrogenase family)